MGAVLVGGRSRRFGSDKAAALLDGRSLLEHVTDALAPHVAEVAVIRAADDRPVPDLGPLGGLAGALHLAMAGGFDRVLVAPCDTPRLPGPLLALLAASTAPLFVADLPVLGAWPAALGQDLEHHLGEGGDRSVRGWARRVGGQAVGWTAIPNVNDRAALASLGADGEEGG